MTAPRDPADVPRHDDERIRRFRAARRRGDEASARRLWDELLTDNFDRVRGWVALESRGRLSPDEQEEALQRALVRLATNMIETFQGTSMGEWVGSTRKLVVYACIDTQRRAAVISGRERSLDEKARGDEDDGGRWDRAAYEAIEDQRRRQESDEQAAEVLEQRREFLDWAAPRLSPANREVVELDRAGVPVAEIQRRLGVTRDVVYARRSRAITQLAKLREEYDR